MQRVPALRLNRIAAASLLAAALAGCATNTNRAMTSQTSCPLAGPLQAACVRASDGGDAAFIPTDDRSGFVAMIRNAVIGAPQVNVALTRWQIEEQKIDVARSALMPDANLFGEGGIRGSYGLKSSAGPSNPYSYGVRVSVPIFDGGRAANTANQQAAIADATKQAALDEMAATLLDLVAAAASVKHADAVIQIRKDQAMSANKLRGDVGADVDAGTASKVDADQVDGQLASLKLSQDRARSERAQAVQSFAEITGSSPEGIGTIGSIASNLPKSQADAEALAASGNPRIARILALQGAATLDKRVADAAFAPNISLDVQASRSGDYELTDPEETDFSALIRFELPIPISGGAMAQQRQKALELRAANLEVGATRNGVFAGVQAAFTRLGLAQQGLGLARSNEAKAKSTLEGIKAERELGERSVYDELSALNAYAEARIGTADMVYELTVAEHLLAAQIGQIDDIYGVALTR